MDIIKGVPLYNKDGKPICFICGKSFERLIAHVRQKHHMQGYEYRKNYGFCKSFAFISQNSKEKISKITKGHKHIIFNNLIKAGNKTRFFNGHNICSHEIMEQRLNIIKNNKLKRKLKQKSHCIDCDKELSTRKSKRCLKCHLKKLNKKG